VKSPGWRKANEICRWDDLNDGVPPRPYILDRGALHTYVRIMYILSNSEPTELIFLQSCRLIPNLHRYSRAPHVGKLGGHYGLSGP
jgi:hypothetical protein